MPRFFNPNCKSCSRLTKYMRQTKKIHPDYYCAPVPPLGALDAYLVIVGLAPGKHGANRSGRVFTGDYAGILLYQTLYKYGFSNQPLSTARDDSLRLKNCRITNAVKCLPPDNKPNLEEIKTCNRFLKAEIRALQVGTVLLALGHIAHSAIIRAYSLRHSAYPFKHGAVHSLPDDKKLVDSYHCSRYNIQTGRLSQKQFEAVFKKIVKLRSDAIK
ncbi:MAG: uracil-DNA glycosylase [Gammaproteobacteria bacterium]|nr:uracil-DNA glycosylase [Gammaproteobacteria bacterium]